LWKTAYNQLDDREQSILLTVRRPAISNDEGNHSHTNDLINEIIRLTEEQYQQYQQKANKKLRASCHKIINAALSFKDIITAVAAFDPTQHAASAWAIVSLGLTVCKLVIHGIS
jgi:acetoin utilization deacetylase AcuC-like enzyme